VTLRVVWLRADAPSRVVETMVLRQAVASPAAMSMMMELQQL